MYKAKKDKEVEKFYCVVIAAFDFIITTCNPNLPEDMEVIEYYKKIKERTKLMYEKKQYSKLRKYYNDMIEGAIHNEAEVLYIKEKTGYDVFALNELDKRINKIAKRKRINTEDEYRDVMEMISMLNVQNEPERMDMLQNFIDEYDESH